jgi:hypothetical protein
MNWTQPICPGCYGKRHPGRKPMSVNGEMLILEMCCDCGKQTRDGIYFRADPRELSYPAQNAD